MEPGHPLATASGPRPPVAAIPSTAPAQAPLVLLALILVEAVANLNLTVANVALPSIGLAFDASQTALDLVAVGYALGLAASVLWFGALGDRHGRKRMLLLGVVLSIPASLVAAFAPSIGVLVVARVVGGISAGLSYPTTLALIAALWTGPARTRAIALWAACGGAAASLGILVAGLLLSRFAYGSVFLVAVPLALVALGLAYRVVPAHAHETTSPVDHVGGVLSALAVGGLVLTINLAAVSSMRPVAAGLGLFTVGATIAFVVRQRRAANPLFDLAIASRRTFAVAACAGIIVIGSFMGAIFLGQQYTQYVLGYSTAEAGLLIIPLAVLLIAAAPASARVVEARGARFTLLLGYALVLCGFVTMLTWGEGTPVAVVALGYAFIGAGLGFAGTPASRSLTGSVPVTRSGMASGTASLQRDLGGALMQSVFGALLTAGYASAMLRAIAVAPDRDVVTASIESQLTMSYAGAADIAVRYPAYADQIVAAAKSSFLDGITLAYGAGIVAVLAGMALVWFLFPRREEERELLAAYHAADAAAGTGPDPWHPTGAVS
jgi:DHA2 family multidrug resistance protein-like MFS transporter